MVKKPPVVAGLRGRRYSGTKTPIGSVGFLMAKKPPVVVGLLGKQYDGNNLGGNNLGAS